MGKPSRNVIVVGLAGLLLAVLGWWMLTRLGDTEHAPVRGEGEVGLPVAGAPALVTAGAAPWSGEERLVAATGLVLSAATGEPVPGARAFVTALGVEWEVSLDLRGAFALQVPTVQARPTGYGYSRTFHSVRAEAPGHLPAAASIRALPGNLAVRAPTLFLRPIGAFVQGTVVNAAGDAVEGARVFSTTTDARGRFGPIPTRAGLLTIRATTDFKGSAETRLVLYPRSPPETYEVHLVLSAPVFAKGRVVDETGQVVPGATVRPDWGDGPQVVTDGEGLFRWPLGDDPFEKVSVTKPGYADPAREHELDGSRVTEIVIYRAAVLSGTLTNADGSPASGRQIVAWHETGGYCAATVTAGDGTFTFPALRPGKQDLQVQIGQLPLGRFSVDLPAPGIYPGHDLRLSPLSEIRGQVVDALDRRPLEGVRVVAMPGTDRPVLGESGPDGAFTILFSAESHGGWFAGPTLVKEGYLPLTVKGMDATHEMVPLGVVRFRTVSVSGQAASGAKVYWDREEVAADENGRVEVELPLGKAVELNVRHPVHGWGLVETRAVRDKSADLGDVVLSGPDVIWTLLIRDPEGEPVPGAVLMTRGGGTLVATADGQLEIPWSWAMARMILTAPGHAALPLVIPVEVKEGVLVVELPFGTEIRGQVIDVLGKPTPGVVVRASPGAKAVTDGNGRFHLQGVPRGTDALVQVEDGPEHYPGPWCSRAIRVWARAGDEDVTLTVPLLGMLRIRPERPDGAPELPERPYVKVFFLEAEDPDDGGPRELSREVELEDGGYRLEVPTGTLRVGFRLEPGAMRVYPNVVIEPGKERVLVYDYPAPGRLTGRITDPEGRPVEGASIGDYQLDVVGGSSDREGWIQPVSDRPVPVGVVRLWVRKYGFAPFLTAPLSLETGADLHVQLARGGEIEGRIRRADGRPVRAKVRSLSEYERHGYWCSTSSDGSFRLPERCAPGPVRLEIREAGRRPVFRDVVVVEGVDGNHELTVPD